MASSEYVFLCACLVTSFGILSISSEAAVSDCEVLNYKTWFAFAKIVYICLVSVMYMKQHISDCIEVCVNIMQQHKCVPFVSKRHQFRREERNFVRSVYYEVSC